MSKDSHGLSIAERLERRGVSRRDFMKFCGAMAAALALPSGFGAKIAEALEKAKKPSLVRKLRTEMHAHALGIVVFQPVVQPLVVAEIESLLLELPLQVPIGLGDEKKVGMRALD